MYYVCTLIGDGSDAEGNQIRPVIMDDAAFADRVWSKISGVSADDTWLLRAPTFQSGDVNRHTGIEVLTTDAAHYAQFGVPDDGERDIDQVAEQYNARFKLRQWLGVDDIPNDLAGRVADLPQRDAIRTKLGARLDLSEFRDGDFVSTATTGLIRQVPVRIHPSPAPRFGPGSFSDDFNRADENLEASANWTRTGGSAGDAHIVSNVVNNNTTGDAADYQCPDQDPGGAADFAVSVTIKHINHGMFICNRLTDKSNWVGWRSAHTSGQVSIWKRVTNSFTQLATSSTGTPVVDDTVKLESGNDDNHEVFVNAVSQAGPVSDAAHAGVTRQGLNPRSSGNIAWLDDWLAEGTAVGGGTVPHNPLGHPLVGALGGPIG